MLVTVAIPFRDCSKYLATAIRSVFAQTLRHWELILVDDGSSDGSLELARKVNDRRVRVVADGLALGLARRLNQIAELAQGELLARMDADDIMHPARLERQVRFLESFPHVDVVGSAVWSTDVEGRLIGKRFAGGLLRNPADVLARNPFIHPTVMARTQWFRQNPYDPRFHRAEDHELWSRMSCCSRFARLPEPLLFYREGVGDAFIKYSQSCKSDRKIFRRYGPPLVGWRRTATYIAKSFGKVGVYGLLSRMGLEGILLARRSASLSADDCRAAEEALEVVWRAGVPGLDEEVNSAVPVIAPPYRADARRRWANRAMSWSGVSQRRCSGPS
jgi:glycosyltransferase involved in cell wall biosynthesis